jgi:hypothetical protein
MFSAARSKSEEEGIGGYRRDTSSGYVHAKQNDADAWLLSAVNPE